MGHMMKHGSSVVCVQITPFLYLAGDEVARDREVLVDNGIRYILNCAKRDCDNYFPDDFVYKVRVFLSPLGPKRRFAAEPCWEDPFKILPAIVYVPAGLSPYRCAAATTTWAVYFSDLPKHPAANQQASSKAPCSACETIRAERLFA